MIKTKRISALIITLVFSVIFSSINTNQVFALGRSLDDSILNKALYTALKICYKNNYIKDKMKYSDYVNENSIIRDSGKKENLLPLPNGYTKIDDSTIGCDQLLSGYNVGKDKNTFSGLYSMKGITPPSGNNLDRDSVYGFLESMGYKTGKSNDSGECISFNYLTDSSKSKVSEALCSGPLEGGKIKEEQLYRDSSHADLGIFRFVLSKGTIHISWDGAGTTGNFRATDNSPSVKFQKGDSWDKVKNEVFDIVKQKRSSYTYFTACSQAQGVPHRAQTYQCPVQVTLNPNNPYSVINLSESNKEYSIDNLETSSEVAATTLINSKPKTEDFTQWEEMALYYTYLKDIYNVKVVCDMQNGEEGKSVLRAQGMKDVKLYNNGKLSDCLVSTPQANSSMKVYGLHSKANLGRPMTFGHEMTFDDILTRLNTYTEENLPGQYNDYDWSGALSVVDPNTGKVIDPNSSNSASSQDQSYTPPNCYSGAGKSIGWILCPVLDFAKDTTSNLYANIEGQLKVKVGIFEGDSMTQAWQGFQNIANIIFIIFLLIVILSQLTGYGIDNYGIKKILPKLIISVILINASFIICQLAVDVSNIVGAGGKTIFDNLASSASSRMAGLDSIFDKDTASLSPEDKAAMKAQLQSIERESAVNGIKAGVGWIATLSGVIVAAVSYVGIIGPTGAIAAALLGLITVGAAIMLVFLLISVRQALIVVLIVTSPLAFICYIFPGTQKLFSRWMKLFTALLLLYPLCGLIVGGSNFASALLLSSGVTGFYEVIVAMLVSVIPFFAIPKMLQSSMSAAGNIGAVINGQGMGLAKAGQGKIRNSEAYKNLRTRSAAGVRADGSETALGGFRRKLANTRFGRATGIKSGMARSRGQFLKSHSENAANDNLMNGGFESALASHNLSVEDSQMQNEMVSVSNLTNNSAKIGDAQSESGSDTLIGQYKAARDSGDVNKIRAISELAGKDKRTAKAFTTFLAEDMNSNSSAYSGSNGQLVKNALSRQMTEGKNSQNFKASDPHFNNYMKDIRSGNTTNDWNTWSSNADNINNTIKGSISNGSEIMAMGTKQISDMDQLISNSGDLEAHRTFQASANSALENAMKNGNYDVTKIDAVAQAAGYSDFKDYKDQKQKEANKPQEDMIKIQQKQSDPFHGLSDDEVLDIATAPNTDKITAIKAEKEYQNRQNNNTNTP